ncbi:hypothetical protein GQ457_09G000620 [Hibiscus cannabinus]
MGAEKTTPISALLLYFFVKGKAPIYYLNTFISFHSISRASSLCISLLFGPFLSIFAFLYLSLCHVSNLRGTFTRKAFPRKGL